MNLKKNFIISMIFASLMILSTSQGLTQNYENIKPVEFYQLAAVGDTYIAADVFITYDPAVTGPNKALTSILDKASKAVENTAVGKIGEAMKQAVAESMKPDATPYTTWSLFPPNFTNGNGKLKVVITYTPDENSRSMGTPQKNNKGQYIVNYKVYTHLKVFNSSGKLIADQNFGIVSGTGTSDHWPAASSSGLKGLIPKVKVEEEGENANHPYEDVCIEGAMEQAKRVVYGMYGIKKTQESIGVYTLKELSDSKDFTKKYATVIENKKSALPSNEEKAIISECVAYWENNLASADQENVWALHHNLAVGYAWLQNSAKANEHFAKLRELNAPTFDKINSFFLGEAKSGTMIKSKELEKLEVFNATQPFIEYYADGINKHPSWPALLEKPFEEVLYSLTINLLIAGQAGMEFPLPVYPSQNLKGNPKKCDGQILRNGEPIINLTYNLKKGVIENLNIEAVKGQGKFSKEIPFGNIFEDGSENNGLGSAQYTLRGTRSYKDMGVNPKGYYIGGIHLQNAISALPFEVEDLKYWRFEDAVVEADFCPDMESIKSLAIAAPIYFQKDYGWNKCRSDFNLEASKINDAGYPEEVSLNWTFSGSQNDDNEGNNFLKNTVPEAKSDPNTKVMVYKKSKKYPISWKFDEEGNWIEISTDEITVIRTIKY